MSIIVYIKQLIVYKNTKMETKELEELIQKEYPNLNKCTYLDHAGASQYSKSQIEKVFKDLSQNILSNPHTNFQVISIT